MQTILDKINRHFYLFELFLFLLLILVFLISLSLGKYSASLEKVFSILVSTVLPIDMSWTKLDENIILQVRLPRAIAAVFIGAGLACAGAVFQGIFRNPLASPYTLGVSNGAGFGAALAILLCNSSTAIQFSAMVFALAAVFLALKLGHQAHSSTVTLILAGVIVGSFFAALVSLIKFMADPFDKLPAIVFWLMGSLASINLPSLLFALPLFSGVFLLLIFYSWRINILSMGDAEARSYGVDVKRSRTLVIICCSIITAASVALSGIIGWIGLVIPHLAKIFTGPDFRRLLPVSLMLGGIYLLIIDDFCRLISSAEIPLGVVTALLGTPIFAYFMLKEKVKW
jgi:iron complex transport system permease protein